MKARRTSARQRKMNSGTRFVKAEGQGSLTSARMAFRNVHAEEPCEIFGESYLNRKVGGVTRARLICANRCGAKLVGEVRRQDEPDRQEFARSVGGPKVLDRY